MTKHADPSSGGAGKDGGSPPSSLAKRILLPSLLVPLVAMPLLSVVVNLVWSTPPTDYGTGSMFDHIAPRYDFINRALALNLDTAWRRRMVREVTNGGKLFRRDGAKILDLATGTADVAILLAEAAAEIEAGEGDSSMAPTTVLGVDPSANMIDVGRDKVESKSLSDVVTLQIGDARDLKGLKDSAYDAATMSFGIRNVPERDVALCEIHRVLKKRGNNGRGGSKLGILEFSEPEPGTGVLPFLARMFIRHIVPALGAVLSGAPREYMHLQNSIKEFPTPAEFRALMEGLECGRGGKGTFKVEEVVQMNFGSVQLYVATPVVR